MQSGNGIGAPRQLQPQDRHAEFFVLVAGILASERHQFVVRQPQEFSERPQVLFDEVRAEAIVARRHRRVRGEHHFARNAVHRFVETQAFILHAIANGFEDRKSAVAFVEVQNARRDAHGFQGAKTSHAEQQFLPDSDARISAIETRRELDVLRGVPFNVRIQKQQIAAAHFHAPDFRADQSAARLDLHRHRFAVGPDRQFHGHMGYIRLQILFLLPAARVEPLPEISLAVEQADADQRNSQIGRALDVIACQNSESAGVFRNRFVQSELGREIRHGAGAQHTGVPCAPCAIGFEVFELAAVRIVDAAVQHQFCKRDARFRKAESRSASKPDCD